MGSRAAAAAAQSLWTGVARRAHRLVVFCHRWARLLSVSRPRVSSCNGPLTSPPPSLLASHFPPGRTRPKKEDWLKKKDRKQRRPGSRRKKTSKKERVSSCPGPLSFTVRLSSVLGTTSSLTLTL